MHGILQARILEWVAISSSGDLSDLRIEPPPAVCPALAGGFFTTEPPGNPSTNDSKGFCFFLSCFLSFFKKVDGRQFNETLVSLIFLSYHPIIKLHPLGHHMSQDSY